MSEEEKKLTAYHESGHAIVGLLVPDHDPVYKVTIIPRGRALGVTMFLPEEDRYTHSRQAILSKISSFFGGRIAESLIFGAFVGYLTSSQQIFQDQYGKGDMFALYFATSPPPWGWPAC